MERLLKIKSLFFLLVLFFVININSNALSKQILQFNNEVSNYFFGIVSINKNNSKLAYNYLNKSKSLSNKHKNFNIKYIQTLVQLGYFNKAFHFLDNLQPKYSNFNEAYLLKGIKYFSNGDYLKSKNYFNKINSSNNFSPIDTAIKLFLINLTKVLGNGEDNFERHIKEIPNKYGNIKLIHSGFINCYFNSSKTEKIFYELINKEGSDFSRHGFFLANYLVKKGKIEEAKNIINQEFEKNENNLLLNESLFFLDKKNYSKIKKMFDCQNPNNLMSEFLYMIASLYANQEDYVMSNYYLRISLYLNKNFYPNIALLAENYFELGQYEESTNIYEQIKNFSEIYFWYASQKIAYTKIILGKRNEAVSFLENQFKKIKKPRPVQMYNLANFYKDNEFYENSIKYYTLVLNELEDMHRLRFEIFDRRGTSFERLKLWEKAENDLEMSLKINPDQPYVLNYLAYSWLERNKKKDRALDMLKKANDLKNNDPYIIDSLGWCMYLMGDYQKAEEYLRQAVEILPLDPVINDHYADALWKQKKYIQARYFWFQVLNLEKTNEKLKKKIKEKMILGLTEKS